MKRISYLDKIDDYLALRNKNEVMAIFGGIFLIVAFVVYLLFYDPSVEYHDDAQIRFSDVSDKLVKVDAYLESVSRNGDREFKIKELQKELEKDQKSLEEGQEANNYFDTKLRELSYLLYSNQNWANFLNQLTLKAADFDIKIIEIQNLFKIPLFQKPEEVLNIKLNFEGAFKNILRYINYIEESKLVVDVNYIDLNSTNTDRLRGAVDVSVWGMRY